MIFKGFLAVLVLSLSFLGTSQYLETQSFDTPRAVTHLIYNDNGSGSVVMIAPGIALTAAHVVENEALLVNGKPIKILHISPDTDIAVIEVQMGCPCVPLGNMPNVDSKVVAIGWPFGEAEYATSGNVQGFTEYKIYTSVPIAPGNSGGGLFQVQNGVWKLVGIMVEVRGHPQGFISTPIHYMSRAIDIETIKKFVFYDTFRKAH